MGVDTKGAPPIDVSADAPRWVSAPGADLVGVAPAGRGQIVNQGTGLAVGFVAGAAALVSDYRPELPADLIRQRLEQTADPRAARLDALRGHGVVDPTAAVAAALPTGSIERPSPVPRSVIVIPPRPVADRRPARVALWWSAAVLGGGAVGSVGVAAAVRGRRRGWKAGPVAYGRSPRS
jgi:subtilisin family serine protease